MEMHDFHRLFKSMIESHRQGYDDEAKEEAHQILDHFIEDGNIPSFMLSDFSTVDIRVIVHLLATTIKEKA